VISNIFQLCDVNIFSVMCHTIAFLLTTRSSWALKSYSTP